MSDRRKRRLLPVAVLLSGTGRTLKNINDRVAAGRLDVEVRLVIASTPKATGVRFAGGAPSRVIERGDFSSAARATSATMFTSRPSTTA